MQCSLPNAIKSRHNKKSSHSNLFVERKYSIVALKILILEVLLKDASPKKEEYCLVRPGSVFYKTF